MESSVLHWVAMYGYAAIFFLLFLGIVGLPVPDEVLLTSCGYLIYQGHLRWIPALVAGFAGSSCGITCSYLIGRTLGWRFLHSRVGRLLRVSDNQIARIHDWFHRLGHWTLFGGYFVPGVRHFTAIVAGTTRVEYRSFAGYAYSGALLWVSTFLFLGYHFGADWQKILLFIEHNLKLATSGAAVLGLGYLAFLYFRRSKT